MKATAEWSFRFGWPAILGAVAILLAWVLPSSLLSGELDDPALLLDQGVWVWRGSWTAWGLFLIVASGSTQPVDGAASETGLFAGGADRAVLAVVILAAIVRVIGLNGPLWFDEVWMHTDWLSLAPGTLVRTFGSDNNHPLYTLLARLSVGLFGDAPWTMRLPAAVFGVGSVWAVYVLGRDRVGKREALLAAVGLALAYPIVAFAQDARGYTGLLFFGLLATHVFLDALDTGRTKSWVLHGVFLALAVYTHLTGAFIAIGHVGVWLLRLQRDGFQVGTRAGLRGLFFSVLCGVALHALILPQVLVFFLFRTAGQDSADSIWNDPSWLVQEIARTLHVPATVAWVAFVAAGLLGLAALGVLWQRRRDLAVLLVVPPALLGLVLLVLGRNLWPRLFFSQAGFGALAGAVLLFTALDFAVARSGRPDSDALRRKWSMAATVVCAIGLAILLPRVLLLPKQDYPAARDDVIARATPGEPIATIGLARYPYQHYYKAPFQALDSLDDFHALFPEGRSGYVLNTFPVFVTSRTPKLWEAIQARATEVARFRGSKGGGDVVVLRIAGEQP